MNTCGLKFYSLYKARPHKRDREVIIFGPKGYVSSYNMIHKYNKNRNPYEKLEMYTDFYKQLKAQVEASIDHEWIVTKKIENAHNALFEKMHMLYQNPELDYIKLNHKGEAYVFNLSGAKKVVSHIEEHGIRDNIHNTIKSLKLKHSYQDCIKGNSYPTHYPTEDFFLVNLGQKNNLDISLNSKHSTKNVFYFSQNGIDKYLIDHVFKRKKRGFYIECGATNGINSNNTLSLSEFFGWRGLLIEPSLEYKNIIWSRGNKDIICNTFLSSQDDVKINFVHHNRGCFAGDSQIKKKGDKVAEYHQTYPMYTKKLSTVLLDLKLRDQLVDFLCLNVNGHELEVVKGIDFNQNRIMSLLIKSDNKQIDNILEKNNYIKVKRISTFNLFFHKTAFKRFKVSQNQFPDWKNYW